MNVTDDQNTDDKTPTTKTSTWVVALAVIAVLWGCQLLLQSSCERQLMRDLEETVPDYILHPDE